VNRHPRSAYPVLALLAVVLLVPIAGLLQLSLLPGFGSGELHLWENAYIRRVFVFSLWQALLSTLLSVVPAILVARTFAYHPRFPFRTLLLKLFALPLVVPSVVAVMAIVSIYGSDGWIPLGRSLYGLQGILLAHVFFNLPLAVRLLLPLWQAIPQQHWQTGEQLGFGAWHRWRYLEWPMLREGLPGILLLVFMLCLTSFAVVLTLGGGPASTTLEVAIYQSLRFEFEPAKAVVLALMQLGLCILVALFTLKLQKLPQVEITLSPARDAPPADGSAFVPAVILVTAVFVGMPLLAMFIDAFSGPVAHVLGDIKLWQSAAHTVMIGLSASAISVVTGWLLLRTSSVLANRGQTQKAKYIELSGSLIYVFPPLVIGTGIFVLLAGRVDVFNWVFPIVIMVNALMGMPFVIRTLGPAMRQSNMRYDKLCLSLALTGWHRFRLVDWPILRRPVGLSAALVAALAMGDLGVIALFGTPQTATLPLVIYQQLGAYLVPQAAVTAALLLTLCLLVFWLLEYKLGGKSHA